MSLEAYRKKRTFSKTPEPTGGRSSSQRLLFVIQKHQASHLHYDFRLEIRGVLKSWAVPKGPSLHPSQKRLAQLVEDHPFDYKDFEGIIPEGNYGAGTVIIWDQGSYAPAEGTGDKEADEKILLKQFWSGRMKIIMKGKKLRGAFTLVKTPDRGHNAWLLSKLNDDEAREDIDITQRDQSVVSGMTVEEMQEYSGAAVWQSNRNADGTMKNDEQRSSSVEHRRKQAHRRVSAKEITKAKGQNTRTASKRKKHESSAIIVDTSPQKNYKQIIEFIKRDFKKQKKTSIPHDLAPMLATRTSTPFDDADWLFELKWDGFRSIAYINENNVQLRSRSNLSYNKTFPLLVEALQAWPVNAVVDGEIVVLNEEGKPDFGALQNYGNRNTGNLAYYVFDALWLDGLDLMRLPLAKRKDILKKIAPDNSIIRFSDSIEEVGKDFFAIAKKNELEGIVAKKKSSLYMPGRRTAEWLKIPTEVRQEFVIGGYTESDSGRPFRSLLFGYYENGKLINAGHAGGGFREKAMKEILQKLKKLETKKNPFSNEVEADTRIHWVKPELVAEIKYASLTHGGKIRKPAIFLGWREDKDPKEVVNEGGTAIDSPNTKIDSSENPPQSKFQQQRHREAKSVQHAAQTTYDESNWPVILKQKITNRSTFEFDGKEVELTNVDKKLWNGITKADLLMYYHAVYPFIIGHLEDRPLSLHIKHLSPTAKGLYIKDMEGHQPEWASIHTVERKHKKKGKRDTIDYLVCNDEATLQYVVNLGCIDINPWTSRISSPEKPDYIIIDLDPSDDDFNKAIQTAGTAKEVFDKHKMKSFVKTSGKTGIHLFLPCEGFDFTEARTIAENICEEIHRLLPEITTTEVSVNGRGDKLYIDPNQNDFADTVASAYSMRPYHLPTISTPLDWKEVNSKLNPHKFTTTEVLKRLKKKGDLWKDLLLPKHRKTNVKALKKFL